VEEKPEQETIQVETTPEEVAPIVPGASKQKPWLIIGLVALVVLFFGTTVFFAYQNFQFKNKQATPVLVTPTPTPEVANTPSPTSQPTNEPAETPQLISVKLAPMDEWQDKTINNLKLKIPPQATLTKGVCHTEYEECYIIHNHETTPYNNSSLSLWVKTYQGGSRRQEADLTGSPSNYSFTEKTFGDNNALEAYFNCQIEECLSLREIILVVNDKLIHLVDDRVVESLITNSIVASIKVAN